MPTRRTTISRAAATRRSIARCWGSTEKITEKIIDKRGEGRMTTTLHKGRLFWLCVLALFTAAASLAIRRSEEHTSALQSLLRISYAVFCLQKKTKHKATPE